VKLGVRHIVIAGALLATLAAAFFAPSESGEVISPVRSSGIAIAGEHRVQPVVSPELGESVLNIHPRGLDEDPEGAFTPSTWVQPKVVQAPKAVAEPPSAPPQAPPLPFRVLGRYVDGGAIAIFVQQNDRNLVVRTGDTIDDTYKIESIAGGTMTIVYLPLNQKQTLAVGDTN